MNKKIHLYISIMIVGAAIMIYELVGSRIMAPQFGNAIFVWTNIIGVILSSLSLGYYIGGRYADRNPDSKKLVFIILSAALLILLNIAIKDSLLVLAGKSLDIVSGSLVVSLILFAPASFFLGMVTPYATKLALNNLNESGSTVGKISAISTIGSILGTFSAGLILIPLLGSTKILYLIVVMLLIAAALIAVGVKRVTIIVLIFFSVFLGARQVASKEGLEIETLYSHITIKEGKDINTGKETVSMMQDRLGIQSAMFKDSDDLVLEYTKYFRLSELINPNIKKALMIGGAAYSYPKDYLKREVGEITVVEIDPKTTDIAKNYFRLEEDPKMKIVHQDGRVFLNNTTEKYDAIMIDAFTSTVPPYHLGTEEAIQKEAQLLNERGVLVVNLIARLDSKYFKSEYSAYKKYFKNVYVFPVQTSDKNSRQNVILVASDVIMPKDKENKYGDLLKKLSTETIEKAEVFTDDYSPVEFFAAL